MNRVTHLIGSVLIDKNKIVVLFLLLYIAVFSFLILKPKVVGDSLLYTSSIEVLSTKIIPEGFVPMMIVSTFIGLKLLMILNFFTGQIEFSWMILDTTLYLIMGMFFYSLVKRIIKNEEIAFISTLFLATNYAAVSFGLGFMMDMGGWAAYVASIYYSYRYIESKNDNKWIYISSVIIGVGGLYKEYAFVACVVLAGVVIWKNYSNWKKIISIGIVAFILSFMPILILNIYSYYVYHYTYIDWFIFNQGEYSYQNRLVEFVKAFGSIFTIGWLLFIGGLYFLIKRSKNIFIDYNIAFIWFVIFSSFAVLLWPVVTRVLFITMPATILVSSLFIERFINKFWIIFIILVFYIISAYYMDSFILNFVNLPF